MIVRDHAWRIDGSVNSVIEPTSWHMPNDGTGEAVPCALSLEINRTRCRKAAAGHECNGIA